MVLIEYSSHEYLTCFWALLWQYISDRANRVSCNWVFWHISTWNDHLLFLCLETVLLLIKKWVDSSQNIIEASCARRRNQCLIDCNLMEIYRNLFSRYHLIRGYLLIPPWLTNNFLECFATLACTRLASHFFCSSVMSSLMSASATQHLCPLALLTSAEANRNSVHKKKRKKRNLD